MLTRIKRRIYECPSNGFRRLGENLVQFLDMICPPDAQELQVRLVVLEGDYSFVAIVRHDEICLHAIDTPALGIRTEESGFGR